MGKPKNYFSLRDKTVLIVGGHGLYGDALVQAFVDAEAKTYIAARNMDSLEKLREKLPEVIAMHLDLSLPDSISELTNTLFSKENRIDILVNNAVARTMKDYHDPLETFGGSMAVNGTGLFSIMRLVGDHMAEQNGGSIINIGSIQGMVGPDASLYEGLNMTGFIPDYFFHKAGMINLTRFIAAYYGPFGVRCNCISPGGVFTEKLPEEFVERYCKRTMLGRMANPDDIIGVVLFLASDASHYVTGVNIPVDGGYTAK